MNIQALSTSERILLAEKLWDSVHDNADSIELSAQQKALLDHRLAESEADDHSGESWETVKSRIINR